MKKTSLWIMAAVLSALVVFGQWVYAGEGTKINLQITGMKCTGCEMKVKSVLAEIKGVVSTEEVSAAKGLAVVTIDKALISEEKLVQTLAEKTGYKVSVMKAGAKVSAAGKPSGCCAAGQENPACKNGEKANCNKKSSGKCEKP